MALERICSYRITGVPGFEGVEFTDSSKDRLVWPDAVTFAADQNAVIQSAREAAAFRIEAGDQDSADRYQATRTVAVYFNEGGKFYVAFDESPSVRQNIILARVQEGYDAHLHGCEWVLSKKDKHIVQILKRAEKSGRIIEAAGSPLVLAANATDGVSAYGQNKVVQALLGNIAEAYAAMLSGLGFKEGYVQILVPEENLYKHVNVSAIVRPVGLGVRDHKTFYVGASQFHDYCHARGVRGAREFVPAPSLELALK